MTLAWIPELNPASGTIGASGFIKLLGRPKMDPLTVLVRETAQNSWDARDDSGLPVRLDISGKVLSTTEVAALALRVFPGHETVVGTGLGDVLASAEVGALYLTDKQTKGLGGPLLASLVDDSDVYDWVDFVLNVGIANSQSQSGGTYGFGKTIAYVVSKASSVVVFSRTTYEGVAVSRLMACAIGEKFSANGKWHTGRHWWGVRREGACVPVEGAEAEALARAIGMPPFHDGEFGTSILVIDPNFGGRSASQAMNFIAETVLWHLWPKLVGRPGVPRMDIRVRWNDTEVPIPRPEDRPPLDSFVSAYTALTDSKSQSLLPGFERKFIGRMRPKRVLVGELGTLPAVFRGRASVDDGHDPADQESPNPAAAIVTARSHHVALLRSPDLVVQYMEGPPSPESGMEWAGVFRVDDAHDTLFSQSEPPTHDAWQPELLDKQNRSTVAKALKDIRSAVTDRWGERRLVMPADVSTAAVVAERLSHLVGGSSGGGAASVARERTATARVPRARVEVMTTGPVMIGTGLGAQTVVRVTPKSGTQETLVTVSVGVAIDGSSEAAELDPKVRLVDARYSEFVVPMRGTFFQFVLQSTDPTDIEINAARSEAHSLLFDIEAEALDAEERDQ